MVPANTHDPEYSRYSFGSLQQSFLRKQLLDVSLWWGNDNITDLGVFINYYDWMCLTVPGKKITSRITGH